MSPLERCEAYFDGDLSPDEATEFRAWLRADAANVREFVRFASLHRALREEFKGRTVRRAESSAKLAERAAPEWQWTWRKRAVAAAILLLAAGGIYWFAFRDPALAVYEVRIEKLAGPVFTIDPHGVTRSASKERELLSEKASLEFEGAGEVVLRFLDGTTVEMVVKSGGGALHLSRSDGRQHLNPARAGKRVTIERGILTASVAHQSRIEPMILCTPQAELTVIGTQFRLEAAADFTRLDVTEGKVRIVRYSDLSSADVSTGEYTIVNEKEPVVVRRADK